MQSDLEDTVVRICPACGVVNPSVPGEACPHHQLVRFDGISKELSQLISEVAVARNTFTGVLAKLNEKVKHSVRICEAEIETDWLTRKAKSSTRTQRNNPAAPALSLENPPAIKIKPVGTRKKKRTKGPFTVNPRQLELIAREPAKGDA